MTVIPWIRPTRQRASLLFFRLNNMGSHLTFVHFAREMYECQM